MLDSDAVPVSDAGSDGDAAVAGTRILDMIGTLRSLPLLQKFVDELRRGHMDVLGAQFRLTMCKQLLMQATDDALEDAEVPPVEMDGSVQGSSSHTPASALTPNLPSPPPAAAVRLSPAISLAARRARRGGSHLRFQLRWQKRLLEVYVVLAKECDEWKRLVEAAVSTAAETVGEAEVQADVEITTDSHGVSHQSTRGLLLELRGWANLRERLRARGQAAALVGNSVERCIPDGARADSGTTASDLDVTWEA